MDVLLRIVRKRSLLKDYKNLLYNKVTKSSDREAIAKLEAMFKIHWPDNYRFYVDLMVRIAISHTTPAERKAIDNRKYSSNRPRRTQISSPEE